MKHTPTPKAAATPLEIADCELQVAAEAIAVRMAARLENVLPGISEAVERTVIRVSARPGKPLGHFVEHAHVHGGTRLHEIWLNSDRNEGHFGGERRGTDCTLTLAHELAHLYVAEHATATIEVHDEEFARIAELAGCLVKKNKKGEHLTPDFSRQGAAQFADLVAEMEGAFSRHSVTSGGGGAPATAVTPRAVVPTLARNADLRTQVAQNHAALSASADSLRGKTHGPAPKTLDL